METIEDFPKAPPATAEKPLIGLTVLVVEDSRFASDALRLLCLRSGARIRRADSLSAAERHLRVYRPGAVIVDLGLPDGSGADLIARLARAQPRIGVILGMSGNPDAAAAVAQVGADGFLEKPILSLYRFQGAILDHMPADRRPIGPRGASLGLVTPDPIAYRDDLAYAAQALDAHEGARLDYATQFLSGVARSAGDVTMTAAVDAVTASRAGGAGARPEIAQLTAMLRSRLAMTAVA